MQHQWWRPMISMFRHSLNSLASLTCLTVMTVCGDKVISLASGQIESKFVIHVLDLLKYAIVLMDALFLMTTLVDAAREKFRSLMR
jgi:hypothetical protein